MIKHALELRMLLQDMGFSNFWYDSNINNIQGVPDWVCELAERILEAGWAKK